jgi:hypothetical protein
MRAAVIEYNGYHEETLPTFVWLLNELGIEPDVYMVRHSRRRGPFDLTSGLRFRPRRVEMIDAYRGLPFRLRRYQLVIVSSMEPATNVQQAEGLRAPLLGVMHNTELLSVESVYRSFFEGPKRLPLVLGRYIAGHVAQAGPPVRWISHVYFGPSRQDRAAGPTTFAVSGNVEFSRRNYDSLLDAVGELVADGVPIRIRIVGRSSTPDGLTLRTEIERRSLSSAFELSPSEISHPEFFQLVAGSDFVLPLLDHSADRLRPYFESKLASSVPIAIGLGVPLVIHRDLAAAFGVEACGVHYDDGGLTAAMRTAIASSHADREGWRTAAQATRSELLAASLANLREAIAIVRRH